MGEVDQRASRSDRAVVGKICNERRTPSEGVTTTAIDPPAVRRFTMKEILARPETFTHPDLLVNTGMLLVDMRDDWIERAYFTITAGS